MQVEPQLIPAGVLETVPLPVPALVTVSALPFRVNVAVTACAALIVTAQVPVPEHPLPLHPAKLEPVLAVAVSVTTVLEAKLAVQVEPQLIPTGLLVTVPLPVPALLTVSAWVVPVKVAVTDRAALIVTTQVPVPEHPLPLHPAKLEPASGAAVSVATVLEAKLAVQVEPQLIPAGLLVTVPLPVPALLTVSAYCSAVNVAVTLLTPSIVSVQGLPCPAQAPSQAEKP